MVALEKAFVRCDARRNGSAMLEQGHSLDTVGVSGLQGSPVSRALWSPGSPVSRIINSMLPYSIIFLKHTQELPGFWSYVPGMAIVYHIPLVCFEMVRVMICVVHIFPVLFA